MVADDSRGLWAHCLCRTSATAADEEELNAREVKASLLATEQ